jgi:hypothetical protein
MDRLEIRIGGNMKSIETLVGDCYMLIDLDTVWANTFAYWDSLVPTETADRIATAVLEILKPLSEDQH